jgi:hypothetical protein
MIGDPLGIQLAELASNKGNLEHHIVTREAQFCCQHKERWVSQDVGMVALR